MSQNQPICSNYDEVFAYYKQKYEELAGQYKNILKTDSYNEFIGRPLAHKEHTLLEINPKYIPEGYNVIQGDIRSIPFPNHSFDLVADFSTLDHINLEDVDKALNEYLRVAGKAYIIVWTHFSYFQTHDEFNQNFFPINLIIKKLQSPKHIFTDENHFLKPQLWEGYVGIS